MRRPKPKRGARPPADAAAESLLAGLEDACRRLGIAVSYDAKLAGRGGGCTVRGERRVILNRALAASEKIDALLEGLADLPEDETMAAALEGGAGIPAETRERLREMRASREAPERGENSERRKAGRRRPATSSSG